MFFPMSCISPSTVARSTRPPPAPSSLGRYGLRIPKAKRMASPAATNWGRKKIFSSYRRPTSSMAGTKLPCKISMAPVPAARASCTAFASPGPSPSKRSRCSRFSVAGSPPKLASRRSSVDEPSSRPNLAKNSRASGSAPCRSRTAPTVSWLEPDDRTLLGFTSTYGTISQPNTPSISTSIYHGDAEQDEYFTRDFYALVQALYDHNSTTGLDLQQIYGAGLGYTVLRSSVQQLNLTLTGSYTDQQFAVASADQNLVGATFTVTYFYKFSHGITVNENSYITPEFNNTRAWLAYLSAGVSIPVLDSLAFSLQAIDNYWNAPAPGFVNNSFQLNTNLSYAIPSF